MQDLPPKIKLSLPSEAKPSSNQLPKQRRNPPENPCSASHHRHHKDAPEESLEPRGEMRGTHICRKRRNTIPSQFRRSDKSEVEELLQSALLKGERKGKAHLNWNAKLPRKVTTKTHKTLQSLRITSGVEAEGIKAVEQLHRETVGEIEEIGHRVSGGRGLVGKELGFGEALTAYLDHSAVAGRC